ncbi:hypothetical protein TCAL_17459, partial [Tigriopus californicus]
LFSIFNIVTFKNEACATTGAGNLVGTCLTSTECTAKGGSPSGNCAAGFGVCCLFSVGGDCSGDKTISQNNGYPSADSTISETCTYNFDRICDSLCGTAADAITVTSPFSSSANAFPPTVCGTLTGQHRFCRLQISEATAMTPDPFILSANVAETAHNCATLSYVTFTTPTNSMFCGGVLSSVVGDMMPGALTSAPGDSFLVGLRTLADGLADRTGFNLNYKQVACP